MLAVASFAQSGPPGGGSGQMDGNPWNPANWDMNYQTVLNGEVELRGWKLVNGVAVEHVENHLWSAPFPGTEYFAYNLAPGERTISAKSQGKIIRRIKWVSPYPAPNKILVSLTAEAIAGTFDASPSAIAVANGLMSAVSVGGVLIEGDGLWSHGEKKRLVEIDGNGVGNVEIYQSSFVEGQVPQSQYAGVGHPVTGVTLSDKAVGVAPWLGSTYFPVFNFYAPPGVDPWIATKNDESDPTDYEVDTVISERTWPRHEFGWYHYSYDHALFGNWGFPLFPGCYIQHGGVKIFTDEEVAGMIEQAPYETYANAFYSDGDQRQGKVRIRVHAPLEVIYRYSEEKQGAWYRANHIDKYVAPGQTATFQDSLTVTDTVTESITNTAGLNLSFEFNKIFTLALTGSRSWQQGTTASISTTMSSSLSHQNPEDSGVIQKVYLVRAKKYLLVHGGAWVFGSPGFEGTAHFGLVQFLSGSKEAAERGDYAEKLVVEVVE